MADIDRLTIEIEANADSAVKSVKNLASALKALNKALGGFDADSTRAFTDAVSELAEAVSMFTSNSQAVKDVAQAFKDLGKSVSSIRKAKGAAEDIAQAFNKMREATNVSTEVANISTALSVVSTSSTEVAKVSNALIEVLMRVMRAFANAADSGKKMIEEMNVIDTTFREIIEPAQAATTAINTFSNEMLTAMSNVAGQVANAISVLMNAFYRMVHSIEGASGGGQHLIEEMNVFDTTFREVVDPVDEASDAIHDFANAASQTGNAGKDVSNAADDIAEHTKKAGESAEQGANKTHKFTDALKKAGSAMSSFLSSSGGISSALRSVGSVFSGLSKKIHSSFTGLKSFGKEVSKLRIDTPKLVRELTRMSKMLKLMVTRMALRAVIKEVGNGFKSLALHSEEFNKSVSSLLNGSKQLGYSFSAMVSPLINAFAPAIRYAINLLIKFANAIQQVFASLTGAGTWFRAKEFTDDWADSIKDANKEAKKLKKTVLGFDELNQLQEKTTGGDTSKNIEDMFETVKVDKKWKDLADWLKQMWKLGDFYDLGKKIGEKLRDMLESIPWEMIRKTSNKLGRSLATLINGFVEVERLGYDIGKTIAQSVNTVFEFLNGFVHSLHWDSIGKFIADTFNGFFENIDWALIKDTVVTGMAGLAETLQNFIDTFHWDNISDFVINGIDTVSKGIKTFVDGIKWEELGVKVGDQINKIMEGVDWHDVGDTLGAVIEAAIDWAYGLVTTFSVDDAVQAISDFLKGVCERVDTEKAGVALGTALHKLIEVIKKFWKNQENRDMIKEEIFGFFRGIFNSMTLEDWEFIAGTVGALMLVKSLKNLIGGSNAGITVAVTVTAALVGFKLGSRLGEYLTGDKQAYQEYTLPVVLKWVIENLPKSWDDFTKKCTELSQAWYDMLSEGNEAAKFVVDLLNPVLSMAMSFADIYRQYFAPNPSNTSPEEVEQWMDKLNGKLDTYIEKIKNASSATDTNMSDIKRDFSDGMGSASKDTEDATNSITTDWDNAKNILSQATNSIRKTTDDDMGTVKKAVSDCMGDIIKSVDDVKNGMTEKNWTFEGVWKGLTKTFEEAKKGIEGIWNKISEKLNGEYEIGGGKFRINLPKFAGGGFPENGLFMANSSEMVGRFSNGRTAVANNEQIVEGISAGVYNAVAAALASSNNGNSGYIANTIVVDGEVIARTVTKAQERQQMRYSPSMG